MKISMFKIARTILTLRPWAARFMHKEIRSSIKEEIISTQKHYPSFLPGLTIVQVGDRDDSNVYINQKLKAAAECGIHAEHLKLPKNISQPELKDVIEKLNFESSVHGMIVQLPLDTINDIDSEEILNAIHPGKDVDGLHGDNSAKLSRGDLKSCIIPCTPRGCLELIKKTGIEIKGKRAVVLGRSKIVGMPMFHLLIWNHATATLCHSRTKNIDAVCREADILVAAIGSPLFVKGDWIKPGAVVIDCGISYIPDSSKKSGRRLVGDVDYEEAKKVASYITPVPGGVGPMTVAMLLKNTLDSATRSLQATESAQYQQKQNVY